MARLRKAIFNNGVYFLTLSTASGIMLPANPLMNFLLKSALLRAQMHHNINISHLITNGTHLHMISRVWNPEDIPKFMERFKTESAHYINRLIGRKNVNVWCRSYDSPRLLNPEDVISKIIYLYTNPVKDGIISSIDIYPGVSTWKSFKSPKSHLKGQLISRDSVFEISQSIGELGFRKIRSLLLKTAGKQKTIKIDHNDWMKAFEDLDVKEVNNEIFQEIKIKEKEQEESKRNFMGVHKLINQGINLSYVPKRSGRKMWCICSNKEQRKRYINSLKLLAEEAYGVYKDWCLGDISKAMPVGMFAPRMPTRANLICG